VVLSCTLAADAPPLPKADREFYHMPDIEFSSDNTRYAYLLAELQNYAFDFFRWLFWTCCLYTQPFY